MRSSDSNQKIQELMKDFFLVSSVSVLAIVCSFPLWFTFVDQPARPWHHWVCRLSQVSSQARSVVSWRCQNFCGSDLRVKEFVAVALCYVLCVRLRFELEVAHRSEFLLGRSRAEPKSPQFRRVCCGSDNLPFEPSAICVAALQKILFNASSR